MSRAADSIRKGLEQAGAYAKGDISPRAYRVHVPAHVDVKAIRTKLGIGRTSCESPRLTTVASSRAMLGAWQSIATMDPEVSSAS
jgi:hypothetical protein